MPLLDLYRKQVVVSENPPIRLNVTGAGHASTGRSLLFIHGFGGYAMQWEHQLVEYAERNRVVAKDLRGYGAV